METNIFILVCFWRPVTDRRRTCLFPQPSPCVDVSDSEPGRDDWTVPSGGGCSLLFTAKRTQREKWSRNLNKFTLINVLALRDPELFPLIIWI